MTTTTKTCSAHAERFPGEKAARPLAEFNRRRGGGLRTHCKRCRAAYERERVAAKEGRASPKQDLSPEQITEQVVERHADLRERQRERLAIRQLTEANAKLRDMLGEVEKIHAPGRVTIYAKAPPSTGDAVACALLSDWHVEEPVEAHKVHGINEFNLEVAERRASAFFRHFLRLTDMMARDAKIDRVYLGILGDLFSNYIHEELRESNLLGPAEAANFVLEQLVKGFDFLLKESKYVIDADTIPGNHGRMTLKPRIQQATETSLETFMYQALAMRYRDNPRVNIRVARSKMVYRRYFERFTMRVIHGDDIKFGGGVGGITIPIRKKLAAWDKAHRADLTVMGHFHQLHDGGDFLVNGSLIGYNEFAQAIGASPEEPRQAFFLIHARNGGEKSIVAPIWLDDAHHDRKRKIA